jgi:4'-phosphopantetheinyl transferase
VGHDGRVPVTANAARVDASDVRVHVAWVPLLPDLHRATELDDVEAIRLKALAGQDDQRRFLTSRVGLKSLVGQVAGVSLTRVRLDYTCARCGAPHGRPTVSQPAEARGWQVSLSHCGPWVLVAASNAEGVGVDVEQVSGTSFAGFDGVALSPEERSRVDRLPRGERPQARAALWVRKEAFLKATGQGLSVDPAGVEASELESSPVVQLQDVPAAEGYVAAAVALSRQTCRWLLPAAPVSLPAAPGAPRGATTG